MIVPKLAQKESSETLDRTVLDTLFDGYLKPLRSGNARLIYKVLYDMSEKEHLTTLDIKLILKEFDIDLNKKEINGWLVSLKEAGLVSKEEERGKPTTIDYDDKYTFDQWKLTYLGAEIGGRLHYLLASKPDLERDKVSAEKGLISLDTLSMQDQLEQNYLTSKILRSLSESGGEMKLRTLGKTISKNLELERFISASSDSPLFVLKRKEPTMKERFLGLFGLGSGEVSCSLTEDGWKVAEKLQPDK